MNEAGETPRGLITRVAPTEVPGSIASAHIVGYQLPGACGPEWPEEGAGPRIWSYGMLPEMGAGNKTPVLPKSSKCLLFPAEPSLQPQQKHFKLK